MTKYFTFLIATIIALLSPLHAQPAEHISFVHIGVNEGLSQNTIFDITQDKQGNMWFATHDGLNKYDGYDFTVYQHDEQNPYSIGSDITRACMSDSQGNIWIGTQEGLSLYDATQDKFYNYPTRRIKPIPQSTVWWKSMKISCSYSEAKTRIFCGSIPEPADFPILRCTLRFYPYHLPLSADKETIYTSEVMKECSSTQSPATRSKMSCRRS